MFWFFKVSIFVKDIHHLNLEDFRNFDRLNVLRVKMIWKVKNPKSFFLTYFLIYLVRFKMDPPRGAHASEV